MTDLRRAVVVTGPTQAEVVEIPSRPPSAGEVRVAVEGCGVCGSNLPVWTGRPWFTYPLEPGAPGHEAWGEVVEAGGGVDVGIGQRVAVLSDGAFADELTVPAADVIPLPAALDGHDVPGEAYGAGWNVARRSRFEAGQTVAVVGIGFIGAVVTALAAEAGAHVIGVSRRPFSLDVARAAGAKDVVALGDDPAAAVADLTGGRLCDVVVEAVGTQEPLDLATALTATGGRLVIAGFHQDGARDVPLQTWNWKGLDVINAHERDPQVIAAGVRGAIDAAVAGTLDLDVLVTHRYPLERAGEALDAMVERPDGFLKAVVRS